MQAGKNISANKIFADKSINHPYRCVGGNGFRGYTSSYNTKGHYSIVGRQGALCGCINIEEGLFYATEHAVVVNTYELLSPLFMYYFLTALNLNQYATATAQPGLAVSNIIEVMCPLPPVKEQERIIEKLKQAISLIERYDTVQIKQVSLNNSINERLMKSILQEAIQGKLVPQIEEEGTALELLEQIRLEKQMLVKEGKLKKSSLCDSVIFKGDDNKYYERIGKNITDITDEIPFEIPQNWQWTRLGDVVMINPRNSIDDKVEVGFIPMASIEAGYKNEFSYTYRKWGDVKSGFTHLADDDVAWAKITPCFQNRKSMILNNLPNRYAVGTTELNVLRSYNKTIIAEYLLWFCKSTYFVEKAIMKGTAGQQRVKVDYTPNKLFPLPPLEEQKRITVRIGQLLKILE